MKTWKNSIASLTSWLIWRCVSSGLNNYRGMTVFKHMSFSAVNILTFAKMGIKIQPMEWRRDGETEAEKYGSATLPGALTVEDTKKKIHDVLKYVSLDVCPDSIPLCWEFAHRAAVRSWLSYPDQYPLNTCRLKPRDRYFRCCNCPWISCWRHVAWIYRNFIWRSGGLYAHLWWQTCTRWLGVYHGCLTFCLTSRIDRIVKSKAFAFSDPEIYKLLKCNIYEAKPEELFTPTTSLPQAAMAAIIKAQQLQCVESSLMKVWHHKLNHID